MLRDVMVRILSLLVLLAPLVSARHVVLVSIDGFAAYHLTNQELELPNIRALIQEGAWATNSQAVFPTVTHPNHTTLLTGVQPRVHGVYSNGLRDRRTGESFHPTNKPRKEIVLAPTIFDLVKAEGMGTASFFWPETRDDPAIDFNIPEVFDANRKANLAAVDPKIITELNKAGIPIELYFKWYQTFRQGAGDGLLAEAAGHALKTRKPGLTAIHILVTDQAQHDWGPHHYRSSAALTQADAAVGILRDAVKEAGLADETTFIIAADHGFHSVKHEVNIYPALTRSGILDKVDVGGYGWMMWVRPKDGFDEATDGPRVATALQGLLEHDNIVRVAGPDDMHGLGLPRWEESPLSLGHSVVLADADTYLVMDPESGSMERRPKIAAAHSHGYLPEHPRMRTALVLSGAGVKQGVVIGEVSNLDVAPTIARLLGLEMKNVDGRVLREALD